MSEFAGFLYDGRTSGRRPVTVKLTVPGQLVLQSLDTVSRYPFSEIEVQPRLAAQPAVIELPDGARVEVTDAAAFFASWTQQAGRRQWVHVLESSWPTVLVVLLLTLVFSWFVYDRGIPGAARMVANVMPVTIDQEIGREGLTALDEYVFGPSTLSADRQIELREAMQSVIAVVGGDFEYRLEFRDGRKLGANAFALPSGIIVFTDQLINLAESVPEVQAIMAHEIGHVRNRHSLRMLLQNSLVAGLLAVLTGDVAVAGSIAAGLPTMLVQASYSRDFEIEADEVAREYLLATGQSLCVYADIMRRMAKQTDAHPELLSLLRTHPGTEERVASFCD